MVDGDGNHLAELFVGFLSVLLATLAGWFSWERKKTREAVDDHSARITKLEAEAMTEARTREMIQDNLDPLKEDMRELKQYLKQLSEDTLYIRLEIAKTQGYHEAKEELKKLRGPNE